MPQYDPQRSRSRQRKADQEGPAPVDALLGPDPTAPPAPEPASPGPSTNGVTPPADQVEPVVRHEPTRARPALGPLALAAAVAAVLVATWLMLRRRKKH